MPKAYILDTNVLLADPNAVLSFPDAEVIVPETVLAELDKLKTSRADPDLRFRGRQISRILFDLSENGSLSEGVALPDGGSLRVATLDEAAEMPEGLSSRNSDDRILAVTLKISKDLDGDVALVTNDLNMLLKAQTLGIPVQRHGDGTEGGWARRYIVRPFQRYRVPISILAVAIAVFAAVVVLAVWQPLGSRGSSQLPPEFKNLLSQPQVNALDYLTTLQTSPNDAEALLGMANFYYDQRNTAQQAGDPSAALSLAQQGVRYYQRYLAVAPNDLNAMADYSAMLFYAGQSDAAIQQVGKVLEKDPNNVAGNYNLGIFLWQGNRQDLKAAAAQFSKVIALTKNNQSQQHGAYQSSVLNLAAVRKQAASQGTSIGATETIPSAVTK